MIELYVGIVVILIVQGVDEYSWREITDSRISQSGVQEFGPYIIQVDHIGPYLLGFVLVAVIETDTKVKSQSPFDYAVLDIARPSAGVVIFPHCASRTKRTHSEPASLT